MFVLLPNIIEYNYRSNFVANQDLLFKILDYYIEKNIRTQMKSRIYMRQRKNMI